VLVDRVRGVERRRGRPERRDRQQNLDELGPVRENERHPIAALDADRT